MSDVKIDLRECKKMCFFKNCLKLTRGSNFEIDLRESKIKVKLDIEKVSLKFVTILPGER